MLINKRKGYEIPASQVTPEHLYLSRRKFIKGAAIMAASATLAACSPPALQQLVADDDTDAVTDTGEQSEVVIGETDELGEKVNSFEDITNYNNYYEFTQSKTEVANLASGFSTSPWEVEIGGLVRNPGVYDIDRIRQEFDQEERIYRMRCVEGWSMVIPWNGFPLSQLLNEVEPTSDAKFVRFETIYDPASMPGQRSPWFKWPYVEGLRLDEAMNDLTLMVTGLYGKDLLAQNGAPIRLVVPWKYGFKGIKSIVKIDLVEEMPESLWMNSAPSEYGFYANVNPEVNHPRWSQATERRIGELGRRPTLMFNGYEEQVAGLYEGMDLRQNY